MELLVRLPRRRPGRVRCPRPVGPAPLSPGPAVATGRVRLDRFSPYFQDPPAAHGMANPRPIPAFRYVYPFPDEVLARLAYYYEYDYADGRTLDYVAPPWPRSSVARELAGQVTLRWWLPRRWPAPLDRYPPVHRCPATSLDGLGAARLSLLRHGPDVRPDLPPRRGARGRLALR